MEPGFFVIPTWNRRLDGGGLVIFRLPRFRAGSQRLFHHFRYVRLLPENGLLFFKECRKTAPAQMGKSMARQAA